MAEIIAPRITRTLNFNLLQDVVRLCESLYLISIVTVDGDPIGNLSELDHIELYARGDCEFVFEIEAYDNTKDASAYVNDLVADAQRCVDHPVLPSLVFTN